MSRTILSTQATTNLYMYCSDNIKGFYNALDNRDKDIDWDFLDKYGFKQSDGTYFRVLTTWRSFADQVKEYMRGRKNVDYKEDTQLFASRPFRGIKYLLLYKGDVENPSEISTHAWAGASYHNYGLAIDIVLRSLGEFSNVSLGGVKYTAEELYEKIGLLKLARRFNLEWGGSWKDFYDMAHFQDTSWKLPPEDVRYNVNASADFVKWYWEEYAKAPVKSKIKKFFLFLALGVIPVTVLLAKKNKKSRW